MKKVLLALIIALYSFGQIQAQVWNEIPGYQISYGDVSGITKFQGSLWVKTHNNIYKVTGSTWELTSASFTSASGTLGYIYTNGADLYAGGYFYFGPNVVLVIKWDDASNQWLPIGYTNDIGGGAYVTSLYKSSNYLYVGGFFNSIGNQGSVSNILAFARFDGTNWSQPYGVALTGCGSGIESIQNISDSIYVAGGFYEVGGVFNPSTFRFKEGGGLTLLANYGMCELARTYSFFQDTLYVGGTRQSDSPPFVNTGLTKRAGSTWNTVSNQMRLINTRAGNLLGKMYISGVPGGGLNGIPTNIVSYDGNTFIDEGLGISYPNNGNVYPAINTMFIDTLENKIYVGGTFRKADGNVADNFAVKTFSVVPIHLSRFTGYYKNGYTTLTWRDETPADGVLVEIQKSIDGVHFASFASSTEQAVFNDYKFTWKAEECGKLFYRLLFEGKYSGIISVTVPCSKTVLTQVAKRVRINTPSGGAVSVYSLAGQEILSFPAVKGFSEYSLSSLPGGMYIVRFVGGAEAVSIKVVL